MPNVLRCAEALAGHVSLNQTNSSQLIAHPIAKAVIQT